MTRGVRDSALSDEGQTHDEVDRTVLSLFSSPSVLEDSGRQSDSDGRNHTADHNSSHDHEGAFVLTHDAGAEQTCSGNIRSLVEGAAHVDRHHAREQRAQRNDQSRILSHSGNAVGHTGVDDTHDRVDSAHHNADNA